MQSTIYIILIFSILLSIVQPQTQSLTVDSSKQLTKTTSTSKTNPIIQSYTQINTLPLVLTDGLINPNLRAVLPPIQMTYKQFSKIYKKKSFPVLTEQQKRFRESIFLDNLKKINEHNADPQRKYDIGVNAFADLTQEQFIEGYSYNPYNEKVLIRETLIDQKLPKINIDWSCKSTRVLDQGKCGCGYVMAALSSIQMTMRIHNINVENLSVQQIISCSLASNTGGCSGGLAHGVFDYIKQKGVGADNLYNFQEKTKKQQPPKCEENILNRQDYKKSKVFIKGYNRIPAGNCLELIQKLKNHVVVAKVSKKLLKFYESGTLDNANYIDFDHYVTVVGYNSTNQTFKIKNSWGSQWGDKGFAYLSKNVGICFKAYYPILKQQLQKVDGGCK